MLVVDTSVAVKWVIPEDGASLEAETDVALDLLSYSLIAPDCIVAEFANALFKKIRRGEMSKEQARQSVDIVTDLVSLIPTIGLVGSAFDLATKLDHPVHDCIFLTAAMQLEASLVTADAKFVARCAESGLGLPVYALSERNWS